MFISGGKNLATGLCDSPFLKGPEGKSKKKKANFKCDRELKWKRQAIRSVGEAVGKSELSHATGGT